MNKMTRLFQKVYITFIILLLMMTLCACGIQSQSVSMGENTVDFSTLTETGEVEFSYADYIRIKEYGRYNLITIGAQDGEKNNYITVEEGDPIPVNIPDNTTIIRKPINNGYVVSTSVMDLICKLDALQNIRLSGSKASDWYIPDAVGAMEEGKILYAGKYSAPDYELILSENCDLSIENTMIYHKPETKEKLEELGIPVLVELSSYEQHPLGRLEWIKLYGVLFDKLEIAEDYYDTQLSRILNVVNSEETGKSVAFFYITSNGAVNVRKNNDYISQMIKLSGGTYALENVIPEEENALSTMNMQMEEFYAAANDADILIYNSTIDGEIASIDELTMKSSLLADFEAVKNKNVYCTSKNFFQETTGMAEFMEDLNHMLNDTNDELHYLKKLN